MAMRVRAKKMLLVTGLSVHLWAAANADKEVVPSIEFLEFLGRWTDEYGDEIDLEMLEDARIPKSDEQHDPNRFQRLPGGVR